MKDSNKRSMWWAAICLLFILTFYLRTWNLLEVPPGLTHDEASNAHDASAILGGKYAIYFPSGYGREPLYNYSVALFILLLGESIFTLRFTSVLWGLFTWTLTVALARRWWGRRASVFAGVVVMMSFWAQMMSRVGLRGPVLPALFAASVLFYDHAASSVKQPNGHYLASGLFLGASFYTYMASRGLPLVYFFFLISQFFYNRAAFQRLWQGTGIVIGTAFVTGAPLFIYLNEHPELEQRVAQLGGAITAFFNGNWQPLFKNISDSLPLMLWRADPRWLYNIGGRAALEPLFAVFFLVGVIAILLRIRDKRHRLLLLWLGGGTAPALLTKIEYNTLHAIAALPAAFLCATYGLHVILTLIQKRESLPYKKELFFRQYQESSTLGNFIFQAIKSRNNTTILSAAVLAVLFLVTGVESMHGYFVRWRQNRDVRVAYHHHVVNLGYELLHGKDTSPIVITSLYPGEVHDPYTMDIVLEDRTLPLRWVDGRSAVFMPNSQTRLYMETQTMLPTILWDIIKADVSPGTDLIFRPDDIPATIKSYTWDSAVTWERIIQSFENDFYGPTMDGDRTGQEQLQNPINFADIIHLIGYRINAGESNPGDEIAVLTAWYVQKSCDFELNIFVHLLDEGGAIITQQDYLGAPSWQWEPGDRILHLHKIPVSTQSDSGIHTIAIGLYHQDDDDDITRLPVLNQNTGLDHITLRLETHDQ